MLSASMALLIAPPAVATTWNLAADFGDSQNNPNGPWAYWQGSTLLPYQGTLSDGLSFMTHTYAPGTQWLSWGGPGFLPAFFCNSSWSSDAIGIFAWDSMNGVGDPLARLTWTAPASGVIDISGFIYYFPQSYPYSTDFSLYLGSTELMNGTVSLWAHNTSATAYDLSGDGSFSNLPVTAGEVLSFDFSRTPGYTGGGAWMNLVVSTPEPGTPAMLCVGLLGLVGTRRKLSK
jgi:hypothetical protein